MRKYVTRLSFLFAFYHLKFFYQITEGSKMGFVRSWSVWRKAITCYILPVMEYYAVSIVSCMIGLVSKRYRLFFRPFLTKLSLDCMKTAETFSPCNRL